MKVPQYGSCGEGCLELGKGFINCRVPRQVFGILLEDGHKGDGAETPNKPSIKIGEAQKALQVFGHFGNGPLHHCSYFGLNHTCTFFIDNVPQDRELWHIKLAFLPFAIKLVLQET